MAEPYEPVCLPVELSEVGLDGSDCGLRSEVGRLRGKKEFPHRGPAAFAGCHHGRRAEVLESPVAIVRRASDAFQPVAAWSPAERNPGGS